jgi:hypothetical protein
MLSDKPLRHWMDNFYGYGSWQAKVWFIAYEEGGGDLPEEVAEKVDYFYNAYASVTDPTLCDIRDLYGNVAFRADRPNPRLFTNLYEYRFGSLATQHGVWRNLIAFVHGYRNEKLPDTLAYQKEVFASPAANEALIRLYPLPSPHSHAWYYSWVDLPQLPFLKSRGLYQEHLYQTRINSILENISVHKPDVVLMYGMGNINMLKKSAQEFFPSVEFKMMKAIKQQIPQHHRADVHRTTLLITTQIPALRHNRIETGFDWQEFGRTVRSKS